MAWAASAGFSAITRQRPKSLKPGSRSGLRSWHSFQNRSAQPGTIASKASKTALSFGSVMASMGHLPSSRTRLKHVAVGPFRVVVQQHAQARPAIQQPAASLGAVFQPGEVGGRVVFRGLPGLGDDFWSGVVQEPACQLADLFLLLFAVLELSLADAASQASGLTPAGPVDLPGERGGCGDELALEVVVGVEVDDPLVDASIKLGGIFLGQDGVDGPGVRAVLERIELGAGLAGLGFRPRRFWGISFVSVDLCLACHGCCLAELSCKDGPRNARRSVTSTITQVEARSAEILREEGSLFEG